MKAILFSFFCFCFCLFFSANSQTLEVLSYDQGEQNLVAIKIVKGSGGIIFKLSHNYDTNNSKIEKIGSNGQVISAITSPIIFRC